MIEAVKSALTQYATFSGRARRSEYWFFFLATILASIVALIIDNLIGFPALQIVVALGTFIPSLAVGARRLHDTGRSGWWQLLSFIPLIGIIILIVWWATDSHPDNQHGPNPKGAGPGTYGQAPPV